MPQLVVRRLLIDLPPPIAARFFNALSMSFPVVEQCSIDSVRNALNALFNRHRERQGLSNDIERRPSRPAANALRR